MSEKIYIKNKDVSTLKTDKKLIKTIIMLISEDGSVNDVRGFKEVEYHKMIVPVYPNPIDNDGNGVDIIPAVLRTQEIDAPLVTKYLTEFKKPINENNILFSKEFEWI